MAGNTETAVDDIIWLMSVMVVASTNLLIRKKGSVGLLLLKTQVHTRVQAGAGIRDRYANFSSVGGGYRRSLKHVLTPCRPAP